MPLIELDQVSFSYPDSPGLALNGISLSIEEGEYVAVVGANGSGKSSLLRLLNGLRVPTSGILRIDGQATSSGGGRRAALAAVGSVFQSPTDQIISSSVEEDVAFGPENLGLTRPEIAARVDAALAAVGLSDQKKRASRFLSAGQQQRLAVAGVLAMDVRCVTFDEATAMLDPEARETVLGLLDDLVAAGTTVVHATHDMTEASRASRVLVLDAGAIVFDASPEKLLSGAAQAIGAVFVLGLPDCAALSLALGLEPVVGESAKAIAGRIAAAFNLGGPVPRVGDGADPTAASTPPASARPAFELHGASHAYLRGTANETESLRSIDLAVPPGITLALVGRTGSGKSTALQLLDGLIAPCAGSVSALGIDLAGPRADIRSLRMRAPLAIQRPESALFERYAGDDVAFGPRNLGLSGRALVERVEESMKEAGLDFATFRDRQTRKLSGGEKRRLALAGVLAMEGEALLLDEPTSALDPATKRSILELALKAAHGGATVVMATHSMEEAARADLVAVFSDGRIAALGDPVKIFYDRFDYAWGLRRPFACEVATELADLGLGLGTRPLTVAGLADAVRSKAAS
ncbi:MAG: energy-coupling factor transporter ATPase [Rectinemataceae bacterium]